ncbi:uncharacterized protein G2W53_032992 [Senna tora]|uniref:Uncharacterized protein n=1 Tax=Senna tora TaxID=362788 RepID=A0A834WAM8_9FABA|nr:uncharacterized protein G2W53_032992 [Senna tora]
MARPLISQYLSMLGTLLSGTLSLIHNFVRGTLKSSMAFWCSGSGWRYVTSKEKGKVIGDLLSSHGVELSSNKRGHVPFLCFKIYIFPHSEQLGEVLEGNDKHQVIARIHERSQEITTYLLHILSCYAYNYFKNAWTITCQDLKLSLPRRMECKPHEAEMEMCEKELLVSSPLPHGQAIRFKMKLLADSSIILDEIRKFESGRNFHLREYTKVLQIPNPKEIYPRFPLRGPLFLHQFA